MAASAHPRPLSLLEPRRTSVGVWPTDPTRVEMSGEAVGVSAGKLAGEADADSAAKDIFPYATGHSAPRQRADPGQEPGTHPLTPAPDDPDC